MKFRKSICIIILAIMAICGCKSKKTEAVKTAGVTDIEITIGSSCALGGHASFLGTQTIHGSLAYINKINENGGVHGRKIKLIHYDDEYDPSKTVANTQRLINVDKVFALFDYVGTPTSIKIIDIVHQAKTPLLGLFTGSEQLRTPFRPYIFNVRDSYYAEAEGAVAYFVDKLGLKKIAVMYQEDAFGLAVLTGVQLALQRRDLSTASTATFIRGTMEIEKPLQIIKRSEAEAVIMAGTYSPLAKYIKKSNDSGFLPYFHTVSFVGSEAFAKELVQTQDVDASQYEKIIVTQVVPSPFTENLPAVREFSALFKKYFPNEAPNYVALEGFINAKVLVKALEKTGRDLTRNGFIEALESMENQDFGIGKTISYSVLDHEGLDGIYFSRLSPENKGSFTIFQP